MDLFFSTVFITLDPQRDLRKYESGENTVKHSLGNLQDDELDLPTSRSTASAQHGNTTQRVSPRSGLGNISIID